jgi:hypothetical protein
MMLAIAVILLIVCGLGVSVVIDRRAAKKRQTQYEAVLKDYSDALKPGLSRREVESYLQLRGHPFRQMCCVRVPRGAYADLVKIGQEKAPWYCNKYNIHIALEFATTEPHGLVADARSVAGGMPLKRNMSHEATQ